MSDDARRIVEDLAKCDPVRSFSGGHGGPNGYECVFCTKGYDEIGFKPEEVKHRAGCPWRRARELVERENTP